MAKTKSPPTGSSQTPPPPPQPGPPKPKETKEARRKYNTLHKTKVTMSNGQVLEVSASQAGSIRSGGKGIHLLPKRPFSTEKGEETSEGGDDFDSHKYPPPQKSRVFREIWMAGIDGIVGRSNFSPAHLGLYETYCSLLAELRSLDEFIRQNGMTYRIATMTGEVRKPHPEVQLRSRAQTQLAQYSKLLDIKPAKDKSLAGDKELGDDWA